MLTDGSGVRVEVMVTTEGLDCVDMLVELDETEFDVAGLSKHCPEGQQISPLMCTHFVGQLPDQ